MITDGRLLTDCRRMVTLLEDDLRARSDAVDELRTRLRGEWSQARAAGRTDRAYEDWREEPVTQAAVAWVLGCVFVRFCEDNGLYHVPLLSGPGSRLALAQDYRLAWLAERPSAGDRAWLLEVFRRYAELPGTREIFNDRNPVWHLSPTDDGAAKLVKMWWAVKDDSSTPIHHFWDPHRQTDVLGRIHDVLAAGDLADYTRMLGDLYQDVSDSAKEQYALLQTPEFVESFILDHTLNPALDTFDLKDFRMIDPACGSGHFLLGAFRRLLAEWLEVRPDVKLRKLAESALEAVHGVDVNPFAVAIARFRLLVAAMTVSGVERLADAPAFPMNVAVGDSLLHGTRPAPRLPLPLSELDDPLLRHRYPTEDGDRAHEYLIAGRYHTVVGNPPYIIAKDAALNRAYRVRFKDTCYRQYSMGVPFIERFFDLAVEPEGVDPGGFVGMITANSFMKREFGKKLVEAYLCNKELTHVIDTSGIPVPGHGTATVILFARNRHPDAAIPVRAVLGVRGDPSQLADPSKGKVWSSIEDMIDFPGQENGYISVVDLPRERLATHPWSLQGGGAAEVKERIEDAAWVRLKEKIQGLGSVAYTRSDSSYFGDSKTWSRLGVTHVVSIVEGERVRDWVIDPNIEALFPYDEGLKPTEADEALIRLLWPHRAVLKTRREPNGTHEEIGLTWYEWSRFLRSRYSVPLSITFAFVATHNHFAVDRGGKVFKQTAPVIKLPANTTENDHLALVGLLNSAAACFWLKQVCQDKGVGGIGGGIGDEGWEPRYEYDGSKLKQFPIPPTMPLDRARTLDNLAQELTATLPDAVCSAHTPTSDLLDDAEKQADNLRARMVALQEELDWECYRLYGLTDEDLTLPNAHMPRIYKGQRAFEIVLARKTAAGETTTTWFARHGSTPITELPEEWPESYRDLVNRRIALIQQDRAIGLIERPEYKRRWNWESWDSLQAKALRTWLLNRLEDKAMWAEPRLMTTARLADVMRRDGDFLEVVRLYTGRIDADLTETVTDLVLGEAVPFLAAYRYRDAGLRKRKVWEEVWELQRREDAGEDVGAIPVPPKYASGDFANVTWWRLRGKLDVPKERFVLYPGTQLGADTTPVIGWAGWDHLAQAKALAEHYTLVREEGAEANQLTPLLAGLAELAPWLKQWHNEVDPAFGERLGDFFASFVQGEAKALGLEAGDLAGWRPAPTKRGRRSR